MNTKQIKLEEFFIIDQMQQKYKIGNNKVVFRYVQIIIELSKDDSDI